MRCDRISRLPAKQSRRLILLAWIAEGFQDQRKYTEAEINDQLHRIFDDHALLRRELFEYGYFDRDGGIYWRTKASQPVAIVTGPESIG
jgi:hypothetical protein